MHPDRRFGWDDVDAMRAFIADVAFAHIFAVTTDGPMMAHAPVIVAEDGGLHFHISRGNRLVGHLDGATVITSITANDFYVSPDWYVTADQVPTWDYIAVEAEGVVRELDEAGLVAQLDALSHAHESRLTPKQPWTRSKMAAGRFDTMIKGIRGFALDAPTLRGTRKLSQNKPEADRAGVVAALTAAGHIRAARLVAEASGR